jgi:endonuclease/exonuclease/phosphatase family metal-dependent hydrolase
MAAGLLMLAGVLGLTLLAGQADARKRHKPHSVKVMSRNLYLGAVLDDAANASSLDVACDEAGEVLRDVDSTNFPLRSKALAAEILKRKPDLVGLQEAALWRTDSPADQGPLLGGTPALTVKYDFLKLLLARLNKGPGSKYALVKSQEEFDFEISANYDGVGSGCADSEIDGRLTMRDAILKRLHAGVRTTKPLGANFPVDDLYPVMPAGVPYNVRRGWVRTTARVRGSKPFKFVNTHLESFDNGQTRRDQAEDLVEPGGPAAGKGRVILVGDLNSDPNDTGATKLAYNALIDAGFLSRTPASYKTSGINDELLVTGGPADFTRHIDHILTNKKSIKRLSSSIFGKAKVNGLFPSDHAGVLAKLRIP